MISLSWTALLGCAWINGEVTALSLLACGVLPGALYWTMASLVYRPGEATTLLSGD